jgi:hypothetical protein
MIRGVFTALAMVADAHPELEPHRPRSVRETDEWLWERATEFCAALLSRRALRIRAACIHLGLIW